MPLDDAAPEVQAWDQERQRLELVLACALRALLTHMGNPAAFYLPFDGEMIEIRRVQQADSR